MTVPNIPEVTCYVETVGGQRYAYTRCPFCRDTHMHGAGSADMPPDLGYRVAHCLTGPGGQYRLVPGLTSKPEALTYRQRLGLLLAEDRERGRRSA